MKQQLTTKLFALAAIAALSALSVAEVTYAAKGKFSGRVTIANKAPNTTIYIWQSDGQGGWVNTGFSITTDASGNGTVKIPNTSSGTLLKGRKVTTGTFDRASSQTPVEVVTATNWLGFQKWFASVSPGPNGPRNCSLDQNTYGGGHVLTETWNANMMISVQFNPWQAQWMNMGASLSTTGDLSAQLVELSNNALRVRINGDPTWNTNDGFKVSNTGIFVNAQPWTKIPMFFGYQGSSNQLLDGIFQGQTNYPAGTFYQDDLYVVPQGVILPDELSVVEGDLLYGDMDALPFNDGRTLALLNDPFTLRTGIEISGQAPMMDSFFDIFAAISVNRPGLWYQLSAHNYALGRLTPVGGGALTANSVAVTRELSADYYPVDGMAKAKIEFGPINDEDPSQDGWLCMVDQFYWQGR